MNPLYFIPDSLQQISIVVLVVGFCFEGFSGPLLKYYLYHVCVSGGGKVISVFHKQF